MSITSVVFGFERQRELPVAPTAFHRPASEISDARRAEYAHRSSASPIVAQAALQAGSKPRRHAVPVLLAFGLVVAVGSVSWMTYRGTLQQAALQATQIRSDSIYGAIAPRENHLAPEFSDTNGDLLADLPSDPAMLADPEILVVAHYEGDYDDEPRVDWHAFQSHLAAATGKRVVMQEYLHTTAEVEAVAAGRIHIVIPHSADVPCLVNYCGLLPIAALGTENGPNGNHMVIAVKPTSKVRSLADLQGMTLTCTRPLSITGYRAAVTVLAQQTDMRLDSDYKVYLTDGQARSIRGLAAGWFEAVAISHDKLEWAIESGLIKDSQLRPIYESEIIPRRTVAHIHNLAPELAAKINAATLSFANCHAIVEESTSRPMRFFPTNYHRDFEFVRQMDESFDPRCGRLLAVQFERR